MHGERDGYEALGRWLVELRGDLTQKTLARRLGLSVATVCRAEKGVDFSVRTAAAYDDHYSGLGVVAKGEIIARRYRADDARRLAEAEAVTAACRGGGEEVSPAYRRDFFQVAATPIVAEALDRADKTYRVLTASIPDPWTLDELAEDSVTIAARYWSTPLDRLLPELLVRWHQLADMIDRMPVSATGQRVLELAGTYAYYVARIGAHTGDRLLASKFGRIAARCAEISGDQLLIGSVACFRSTVAFDSARYADAANIAGEVAGHAHPYTRARLHAYRGRALAASGHSDAARDVLADMRENIVNLPPMPGAALFDEEAQIRWSAMILVGIRDQDAEAVAREAVAATPADDYQARALACTALGGALAGRDPGAASVAGLQALDANRAWPSVAVETGVRRLHRTLMARDHGKVAEVVRLGEAVKALRPAAI